MTKNMIAIIPIIKIKLKLIMFKTLNKNHI